MKTGIRHILIGIVIVFSLVSIAQAELKVKEYKEMKTTNAVQSSIIGIEQGINWANSVLETETGKMLFCGPSSFVLNTENYFRILDDEIERTEKREGLEKTQDLPVGKLILKGLIHTFPCDGKRKLNKLMPETAQKSAPGTPAQSCKATSEAEISSLFDRWNKSLQSGDPNKVVANYAARSILLPTVSNKPRLTPAEKEDYFHHFLENQPSGKIDMRSIELGCNTAVDAGLYTFTFAKTGASVSGRYSFTYRWDGSEWLITSHHSSAMPEKK